MFVLPALGSVVLDVACISLFWVDRGSRAIGTTFRLSMADVVAFTGLRLVFLALFAAMYFRQR